MANKSLQLCFLTVCINFLCCSLFGQNTDATGSTDSSSRTTFHNGHYLKPAALIIPGTFLVYGVLKPVVKVIQNVDEDIYSHVENRYPNFHTNAEDYLMWTPSAAVYVMDAFKVKTTHTVKEHLILDAGSIIITGGFGYAMRVITHNIGEFNTHNTKFPSGHTANAFRAAEIFHQELKRVNPLLSYGGYVIAGSVGSLRILNKAHTFTQVIAGAGLGILSTKLTYLIFDKVKYHEKKLAN